MNLYNYYNKPDELVGYMEATKSVPSIAYDHAFYVIRGPFSEGEDAIAKDPRLAELYAHHILKGRFEKAEDSIATDASASYHYSVNTLNRRFVEGEKAIAQSSYLMAKYQNKWGVDLSQYTEQ
ncbi:MAG: hypothetical protein ACXW2E_00035 [Nitrososphaeraceae archaeon]